MCKIQIENIFIYSIYTYMYVDIEDIYIYIYIDLSLHRCIVDN